jgi:hypothetical protein
MLGPYTDLLWIGCGIGGLMSVSDPIERLAAALSDRYTIDVAADGRLLVVARQTRTAPMRVVVSMNLIGR